MTNAGEPSVAPEPDRRPSGGRGRLILLTILLVGAGTYGAVIASTLLGDDRSENLRTFAPTEANRDPSLVLPGVTTGPATGLHVGPDERVAYTSIPPSGGSHDASWINCMGSIYDRPVRTESAVHSLEHGAVWIAFDPARVRDGDVERLAERVRDVPYTMMSPYPGLAAPISLRSWGHALAVADASDQRIDPFITALRQNRYTNPEVGASCGTPDGILEPPSFLPAPPVSAVGRDGVQADDVPVPAPQPDSPSGN